MTALLSGFREAKTLAPQGAMPFNRRCQLEASRASLELRFYLFRFHGESGIHGNAIFTASGRTRARPSKPHELGATTHCQRRALLL